MPIILQSSDDNSISPLTDRERDLVHKLRAMLKDIPDEQFRSLNTLVEKQRGQRWSDELLLTYLQIAMSDINSEPPLTLFTLYDVPVSWDGCILIGAFILALLGESIDLKKSLRPSARAIKSNPAPVRIRSYAQRMWTYR